MEDFKVIIAGGRDFRDYELLKKTCDKLLITKRLTHHIIIVSGKQVSQDEEGTKWGADYLGEQYAKENGFKVMPYPANWKDYRKRAGPIRNHAMALYADALIAFWDGKSPGTRDMIGTMKGMEKRVHAEYYNQ